MIEIDWRSCHSMSEDHELEKMEQWARDLHELHNRDLRIIEIGSFHGKTTALLAQFGKVLAIDLFSNVDAGMTEESYNDIGCMHFQDFIKNMTRLKLIDRVFPIVSTSSVLNLIPYYEADIIFIDGDHHYPAVNKDINNTVGHLASGGLMMFHDYKRCGWKYSYPDGRPADRTAHDPWEGVARAIDEFLDKTDFIIYEHYYGVIALRSQIG